MLTWLHIGDLHVSDEDDYQSVDHLHRIVDESNTFLADQIDFVFLPGDNANHGTVEQYRRINEALAPLRVPVHAVPGDHDFEPGNLDAFHQMQGALALPHHETIKGHPLFFLDAVSAGKGGPDFQLGDLQRDWMERQSVAACLEPPVVFMHAYPQDFKNDHRFLTDWLDRMGTAFVDTGHTHYNELLNDGSVVYGATRSTGQIEEDSGAPGYSIISLDGPHVSWRFKRLGSSWPFVVIISPTDFRLVTDRLMTEPSSSAQVRVRAKVFGHDIASVMTQVDDAPPMAMNKDTIEPGIWEAWVSMPPDEPLYRICVKALRGTDELCSDYVTIIRHEARHTLVHRSNQPRGTDAHVVTPWPEHGYIGTQLGPNKFGVKW